MSTLSSPYPRDLRGYGRTPPHPRWPGGARIAVQFVLNHEEGAENCVLDGDPASETFLSEIIGAAAFPMRHMSMESMFEYGSRAGLWRVLRAFERRRLPLTVFGVARALQRHPEAVAAYRELGHEIAAHGLRWISYQQVDEATERAHLAEAVAILERLTGAAPLGWYTGRDSPNTRRLVVEHGGFLYDSDSYADDLPYWTEIAMGPSSADGLSSAAGLSTAAGPSGVAGSSIAAGPSTAAGSLQVPHLVVPYTLDSNDMRFAAMQGFNSGTQFFDYLKDSFDVLYREGDPAGLDSPKMLSVGLHARLCGRPGRLAALERFLDYVCGHGHVWICRRVDIARHWMSTHPFEAGRGGAAP
ncbi:MAG: allantoinase PuuE [Pseudomonadota bacterium]|nr:allantoinase PuuE [Pseudomonadota bacterium]